MKYIKMNAVDGKKIIIDLDKVESFTTSQDIITFNYHNDEAFVFNNGTNDRGIHITDFNEIKEKIEKLGE